MKNLGELIRDFTLIDLMGILFPGSVLLLLIAQECTLWERLEAAWGTAPENSVKVTFLLVGGYFLGSLLTEAGDLLERIVWRNLLVNPRSSAAVMTGLSNRLRKVTPPTDNQKAKEIVVFTLGTIMMAALSYILLLYSGIIDLYLPKAGALGRFIWGGLLPTVLVGLVAWILLGIIADQTVNKRNNDGQNANTGNSAGQTENTGNSASQNVNTGNSASQSAVMEYMYRLRHVRLNDHIFMGFSTDDSPNGTGGNGNASSRSKQNMFDGFRMMARNMLLVFTLFYGYGRHTEGALHELYQALTQTPGRCWAVAIVNLLLIVRYWRFSYLKYKYCYEDFMDRKRQNRARRGTGHNEEGTPV